MITVRRADDRGHAEHGWLNSYHTFSFAGYHDPRHMGYRSLRVINEDRVQGGEGFDTHSHRDFEIISYIVDGALRHKDSMGHTAVMRSGDVQRITAGTGIAHSEFNDSPIEPVHFLQIWIEPSRRGLQPDYAQRSFRNTPVDGLVLACSPDGRDGSIQLNQNAEIYIGRMTAGMQLGYSLGEDRHAWVQLIGGDLTLNTHKLAPGDGASFDAEKELLFASREGAHFLLFDLN